MFPNSNDRNLLIEQIRVLNPDGIEISFAFKDYLNNFEIKNENLSYLKSLKFNSIHSPWKDVVYSENEDTKELLKKLHEIYKKINARNIVFHKQEEDDFSIFSNAKFTYSIENECWIKQPNTPEEIKQILDTDAKMKFTLDFAHAISISLENAREFIEKLKDRMIQVHMSYLNKEVTEHKFLHTYDSPEIRALLKQIPEHLPLILECVASNETEFNLLQREIEYLRSV